MRPPPDRFKELNSEIPLVTSLDADVIVVGAGVAGIACARDLVATGHHVIVLERSRGVGGRCATRRVDGQAVDHGVPFFHGSDGEFLASLRAGGAANVAEGWPRAIEGSGRPCEPRALAPGEERLALVAGATAFAKRLAQGLDVRTEVTVSRLEGGERAGVVTGDDVVHHAPTVVLTPPAPQARALLENLLGTEPGLRSLAALLDGAEYDPCLTVIAGYPRGSPAPPWDLAYPDDSPLLQTLSHDSTKRGSAAATILVCQAGAAWSRSHVDEPPDAWAPLVLREAVRIAGDWAAAPEWVQAHRWRYSRGGPATRLAHPPLVTTERGARIGLAGDGFSRRGGVEGAWLSGRELARRIAGST